MGLHVRECRLGTLPVLLDLVSSLLTLLLAIEDRLVLRVVDQVVLASDLIIDLGNLRFGVGIPKETLDAGPYLLKEPTESVPSLLQQADQNSPAIGDEVGGFQPTGLQTCPRVGH